MIRVAISVLTACVALASCGGCRHIKAPHPPKEPPLPKTEMIEDVTTRPVATKPAPVIVYETYVVKSGDNLGKIAQKVYGNSHNDSVILDANPGLDPRKLTVGQVVRYPVKKKKTPATATAPAHR